MQAYRQWLARHGPDAGRQVEDALYLATLVLPSGISESSTFAEVAASAVGLLSLLNDAVLHPEAYASSSAGGSQLSIALAVLRHADCLAEIVARRVGGGAAQWSTIVGIECVRAAARVCLLAHSPRSLEIAGGQPRGCSLVPEPPPSPPATAPTMEWWRGSLSGLAIPLARRVAGEEWAVAAAPCSPEKPARSGQTAGAGVGAASSTLQGVLDMLSLLGKLGNRPSYTLPRPGSCGPATAAGGCCATATEFPYPAPRPGNGNSGGDLQSAASGWYCADEAAPLRLLGELLHIARPLLYAVLRRHFGPRAWLPLVVSAALDASSARCTWVAACRRVGDNAPLLPRFAAEGIRNTLADLGELLRLPRSSSLRAPALPAPTLPNPPACMHEEALVRSLGGPRVGLLGLLLRLCLHLFASPPGLTGAEAEEVRRRRTAWVFYLLRSPLFLVSTLPVAERVTRLAAPLPVLNALVAYARDLLLYANEHHYFVGKAGGLAS